LNFKRDLSLKIKMYKIYEIRCNETDEVYIGKTTRTLNDRLSQHKEKGNNTSSKQIILRRDYIMSQIDECDNEEESIFLESYYIRNTDNCVNIKIPGRNKKQYYDENKDEILERNKIYYGENREYFLEYAKEYREENRDEILEYAKEYYITNIDEIKKKRKERYEKNKDEILEKEKKYREKNKDEINERTKLKYTCECGSIIRKDSKARHEKTLLHINFVNSK
jgi:hypothetical protein